MALTFTDLHIHTEYSLPIPGFNNKYFATRDGHILNTCGDIKTPFISKRGYQRVKLYVGDYKYKNYQLHVLIALTFIPNPDNFPQVNHRDGNKLNNHVDNLEWLSVSANVKHGMDNGLYTKQLDNQKKASIASSEKYGIPVEQLDLEGNVIDTFRNRCDASRATGCYPIISKDVAWVRVVQPVGLYGDIRR